MDEITFRETHNHPCIGYLYLKTNTSCANCSASASCFADCNKVAFAKKASTKPELRTAHNLHALSSLLGGLLFIADDWYPDTPYIHAAWHLAAAVGVGTCNKLLE